MPNSINTASLLCLDWFSGVVHHEGVVSCCKGSEYVQERTKISSRNFKFIDQISKEGRKICSLAYCPSSPVIPKNTILIKFENSFLYQEHFYVSLIQFLANRKFKWIGTSRIDVALDFNNFKNLINPCSFISRVKRDIYLRKGRSNYTIIGSQNRKSEDEYLKYGSRQSDVCIYLYNKTYEMIAKKYKAYIVKSWEKAGLAMNENVWRLEFSLSNCRKNLVDTTSGEILTLKGIEITKKENLQKLFNTIAASHFIFKVNNFTKNKSRMTDLKLLPRDLSMCYLADIPSLTDHSRYDKAIIKKLHQHYTDVRKHKSAFDVNFQETIRSFSEDKGLAAWTISRGYNV